jgi:type IV secretory pathway VirB2 component (pilin)
MLRRYRRLSLRGSVVFLAVFVALMAATIVVHAQSPWERAALNLEATFTGPLARSLALVAIVVGGLMFMFGEGGAKRQIAGITFGGGLALFAGQFLAWLF